MRGLFISIRKNSLSESFQKFMEKDSCGALSEKNTKTVVIIMKSLKISELDLTKPECD